ncbi:M36 family metallopeptidase [Kibdelosporangium philippinense]|uniref:M36 family metallopeptidase n=1 Tax=Kibdelosporangium philippinense TaxID=211113 RepID=UPI0036088D44
MYLWQPTPGGFYAPCVDGDYDMSVIGHEYGHAISGRLIAGPNSGWSGAQGAR